MSVQSPAALLRALRTSKLSRRSLMVGLAAVVATAAQDDAQASVLRFRRGTAVADGAVKGTDYRFAPVLAERTIYRTTLVEAGEEVVDLYDELAQPFSPIARTWYIGGADAAKVQLLHGGRLVFAPAYRGSLAGSVLQLTVAASNDFGVSPPVALAVRVVANANCRFFAYESGSDELDGLTPQTAKRQLPGTVGYNGAAQTFGAGIVCFFKGSEAHRYSLSKIGNSAALDHAGEAGSPWVAWFTGWRGRATFDGSDLVSGWTSVTSAEVAENPNWTQIVKLELQTPMLPYQHLYAGDAMCYPAQFPTPADIRDFEGPDDVTEARGLWRISTVSQSGRRIVQTKVGANSSDTSIITVYDDRPAALMAGASQLDRPAYVWRSGNDIVRGVVTAYAVTAGMAEIQITFQGTVLMNQVAGVSAYGIGLHPIQITKPGQYALSPDGLTVFAWLPNDGQTSVSRRNRGVSIGQKDHVVYGAGCWQRFCGDGAGLGSAFAHTFSRFTAGVVLVDHIVRQCRAEGGDGCGLHGAGGQSYGFDRAIVEGFRFEENPRSSGFRLGARFEGIAGGTRAQVIASTSGLIRGVYVPRFGLGRTTVLLTMSDGVLIEQIVDRDRATVHGNVISLYTSPAAYCYTNNIVVRRCLVDGSERGLTCSVHDSLKLTDRNNSIIDNVFLGQDGSAVLNLYSGEPGSEVSRNVIMIAPGHSYPYALFIGYGYRLKVLNNVIAGVGWTAPLIADSSWDIRGNLITSGVLPPEDGGARISSPNTMSASGAVAWDGQFTPEMRATLGSGQIGPFWTI